MTSRFSPKLLLVLWLAALPLFLLGLGTPVVQRTQEARVLETAREMYDSPDVDRWMIPRCNGEVRLNKPPLEYWLPALCFRVMGVGEFAGRLPFALAGWLTLAVVYRFGRDLIDAAFGLLSAAILLSSYMFFRHARLAETDGLAAFFLAAGVYRLWRGATEARAARSFVDFHLAAAALGLVVMTKGPPAAFAVLFFVAWVCVERNWAAVARLLLSGAALTALGVGGTWYFAIRHSPEFHVLYDEVKVITRGAYHSRSFTMYLPLLLLVVAPWTAFLFTGVAWAARRWRRDAAGRALLIWTASVLLPLFVIRQKQNHYLVSAVAPLAMLAAYAIHRGIAAARAAEVAAAAGALGAASAGGGRRAGHRVVGALFRVTLWASLLAPAGVYLAARNERGMLMGVDGLLAVVLLAGVGCAMSVGRRQGFAASVVAYAGAVALAFAVLHARWTPTLRAVDHRGIAASIRGATGADRPCAFYGPTSNVSLPLAWNLRAVVPVCRTAEELGAVLAAAPRTVVVAQTKNGVGPPAVPAGLNVWREFEITGEDKSTFRVYTTDAPALPKAGG